ncbi:GNAT family N-acetyltransferase [Desulfovibrio aminophilus]|nr:GNAT family N-acetyltransferase [Desulfovibrio aminophilus]MCM0755970.1 GNAT family N-acetyltransferase [Desulfovibrio aminophilus]
MKETELAALRFPEDPAYIPVAVQAARVCSARLGFGEADAGRIGLALEEALTNALAFGFGDPSAQVSVVLSRTAAAFCMSVRSQGLPLEAARLPKYDPQRARDHADTAGLDSLLMEAAVDKVLYSTLDSGRREVRLLKSLPAEPPARPRREAPAPELEPRSVRFAVRPARPEDAEGIARLALTAHGALLFAEHIYYPERVREMLISGELASGLAVSEDGEFMGHLALAFKTPDARLAEMTYAFVGERFRGQGCGGKLTALLLEEARRRGLRALTGLAVTNHVNSQRMVVAAGFAESALLLAPSPASRTWDRNGTPGRIGNLVLVLGLGSREEVPVHAPARHREMIERIYSHRNVPVRFEEAPAGDAALDGPGRLEVESDFKEGWTALIVERHGADTLAQVAEELRRARAQGVPSIHVLLPLGSPATPALAGACEQRGFFFSGVVPGDNGGEFLVLQCVNTPGTDYASIHLLTEFARELKDYVRSCDPREG